MKIALMITCLSDVLRPGVGQAVVRILRRLGHQIAFPEAQTCCGQPLFNSGFHKLAREQAQYTIRVFEPYDAVVTPSGSCGAMVKAEYPRLFDDEAAWRQRAEKLAGKTFEFSEFLVRRLGVFDVGAKFEGKVAHHFACHLRLLGHTNEVEQLIGHVAGAVYVPLYHQDQCCGFGGSFAVRYPRISTALVDDKVRCVLASGADALVSTDAGCLMNISGKMHREGHRIEVLHLAELLDRR